MNPTIYVPRVDLEEWNESFDHPCSRVTFHTVHSFDFNSDRGLAKEIETTIY